LLGVSLGVLPVVRIGHLSRSSRLDIPSVSRPVVFFGLTDVYF
jgi:hypothetical protein